MYRIFQYRAYPISKIPCIAVCFFINRHKRIILVAMRITIHQLVINAYSWYIYLKCIIAATA